MNSVHGGAVLEGSAGLEPVLQVFETGYGADDVDDRHPVPAHPCEIRHANIAATDEFHIQNVVGVNFQYFPHHTVPVDFASFWEGALELGVFGLCQDDDTSRGFYKKKDIQFVACEFPHRNTSKRLTSAISAKPIRHHRAKAFIRSITAWERA
jgi:hypothetical protein